MWTSVFDSLGWLGLVISTEWLIMGNVEFKYKMLVSGYLMASFNNSLSVIRFSHLLKVDDEELTRTTFV